MSRNDISLVCEGEPASRDIRWLGLVLGQLAESFEPASRVRVVPAGSKADLGATVRGMRKALGTRHVYAIRDRDFLPGDLLAKDIPSGVYSFERHCLESYLIEPDLLEAALRWSGAHERVLALAEARFWPDVARAVLDASTYELRRDRLHLEGGLPADKADVTRIATSKLLAFRTEFAAKPVDIEKLVDTFEGDMRSAPLWTRVNGKALMKSVAVDVGSMLLPSGDIEAALFKWCSRNDPPAPFVAEVKRVLEALPTV